MVPALAAAGRQSVIVRLHDGERRFSTAPGELRGLQNGSILIVDGYEQLGGWQRWTLNLHCRRRAIGLLVTAHRPCGLPVLYRTGVGIAMLRQIIERRLPPHGGLITPADLERAFTRHAGNVRETLFELYDLFEARRGGL
jgi:hypothetical protein